MKQKRKQFQYTEDGHLILMTPEERKLLIKDLIARIESGVVCEIERVDDFGPRWRNETLTGFCNQRRGDFYFEFGYGLSVSFAEKVRPYLRSLSSITENEIEYIRNRWCYKDWENPSDLLNNYHLEFGDAGDFIDWLIERHFDFRGLIEKGLAEEAPEGMYKI